MLKNTDCLLILLLGDFKNSRMFNTISRNFKNILKCNSYEDALSLMKNNRIDLIICENKKGSSLFSFLEKEQKHIQKQLLFVLNYDLDTSELLKSIELKLDAYLLDSSSEKEFFDKISPIINSYLKINSKVLGEYYDSSNKNISLFKINQKGIITYADDNFCSLSQYSRKELIDTNLINLKHELISNDEFNMIWNNINNKNWKGILRLSTKQKDSFCNKVYIVPVHDINNTLTEYICFSHCIDDFVSDEDELKSKIESNNLSVLALISIEEYKILEKFYSSELIERIEKNFKENLLLNSEHKEMFSKVYALGKGRFAVICAFNDYMETQKNLKVYFDNFVDIINSRVLFIDETEYDLNIVLSYSFGKYMLFEDVTQGLEEAIVGNKSAFNSSDASIRGLKLAKNTEIIQMVKIALDNYNIIPYFQPIINNKTEKIEKYESLVRLIDENNRVLSPGEFLNVTKKSEFYSQITRRVLENSFKILEKINTSISINLSALDIEKELTRELVYSLLEKYKEHSHKIVFELLEDEEAKDFTVIKKFIRRVKKEGVKIALDDFGSGYSSFERVLLYEPDIIKIDGSLIKNIEYSDSSRNLVETIAIFAKKQNIKTIAEYVENEKIFNILKEIGIDYSQGFYFGKPEDLKLS